MSQIINSLADLDFKSAKLSSNSINFQTLSHTLNSLTNNSQSLKYFRVRNQKYEIVLEITLLRYLPTIIKKIVIDRRKLTYQSKFILRIQSGILYCMTKQLRLLLIKEIETFRKKMRVHSYVVTVDQDSGQIICKQIFALQPDTNLNQLLSFDLIPMKTHFCRLITALLNLINAVPPLYPQFIHQLMKTFNEIGAEQKIQYRAYKYFYYNIISYWASLTDATSQSYEQPQDRQLYERLIKENLHRFSQCNVDLYTRLPKNKFKSPYKFQISSEEQNNFRIHLKVPNCQIKKSQSNFIFNQIMVIQESNQAADSGFRGAKTKILLTKLKFFYHNGLVNPHFNHNNHQIARKQYTKLVAIKVPIQNPASQKDRNKEDHQIKILRIFSMKQSPFLLKYYVCHSSKFKYNNMLMMNYAGNCDTISSFFNNRKETMSLTSKIFILINVLQSLKLIKEYQVVHMDLSPGNILVNQNYIPQLIDFGQSYKKQICLKEQNYNPGFTLPFTFPQKFTNKDFNCKSDMFSFAILLLYLIFKYVPYNPTQKLIKSLKNFTYVNKYYFSPQSKNNDILIFFYSKMSRSRTNSKAISLMGYYHIQGNLFLVGLDSDYDNVKYQKIYYTLIFHIFMRLENTMMLFCFIFDEEIVYEKYSFV